MSTSRKSTAPAARIPRRLHDRVDELSDRMTANEAATADLGERTGRLEASVEVLHRDLVATRTEVHEVRQEIGRSEERLLAENRASEDRITDHLGRQDSTMVALSAQTATALAAAKSRWPGLAKVVLGGFFTVVAAGGAVFVKWWLGGL